MIQIPQPIRGTPTRTVPSIAIATENLTGLTGKVRLIEENLKPLVAAGWRTTLFAQRIDRHRFNQTEVDVVKVSRPKLTSLQRLQWFDWRVRRLTQNRFNLLVGHGQTLRQDVVHIHNCYALEAQRTRSNDVLLQPKAVMQQRLLTRGRYDRLIANSQLMADELVARYAVDPQNIDVIYPGVDTSRFSPADETKRDQLRRSFGFETGRTVVALVTSGNFRKRGVDFFIGALGKLPESVLQRIEVVIVGNQRRIDCFQDLARQSQVSIRFIPSMPDVERLYAAVDIVVHPARLEEFGMGVLEAMSCGRAVITNRWVGAAELIPMQWSDDVMQEADDLATLSNLLTRFINQPEKATAMGEALRRVALVHDWAHNAAAHMAVYRRVLEQRGYML